MDNGNRVKYLGESDKHQGLCLVQVNDNQPILRIMGFLSLVSYDYDNEILPIINLLLGRTKVAAIREYVVTDTYFDLWEFITNDVIVVDGSERHVRKFERNVRIDGTNPIWFSGFYWIDVQHNVLLKVEYTMQRNISLRNSSVLMLFEKK